MFDIEKRALSLRGRRWIYGISLAVLPILTAYGLITEDTAVLWATLLGAILVPGLALSDQLKHEHVEEQSYLQGVDEGWLAASDENRRGIELARESDIQRGKHGQL